MSSIRRALAITTVERYFTFAFQAGTTIVVSRLLTPAEIGLWGLAFATAMLLLSAREFANDMFLVQRPSLKPEDVQVAFSVILTAGLLIFVLLNVMAPFVAEFYRERGLASILHVFSVAIVLDASVAPLVALMRRDMAFGDVAIINITRSVTTATVTIGLAAFGFGYMSFAWGWVTAAILCTVISIYLRPDFWIFRMRLRGWGAMLSFGGYQGTNVLWYRVYESMPAFFLGRVLSLDAIGFYNRALLICQLPNNILLGSVSSVVLAALSAEAREGSDLRQSFLRATSLITALLWPALVVLSILAHGLVLILLGAQWMQAVPLIQIMAIAALPKFMTELAFPVLVSLGAMRDLLLRGTFAWLLSALVIAAVAQFGLIVLAISFLLIFPMQAGISLYFVRRHLTIGWRDLANACWKSVVITGFSAVGPLAVLAWGTLSDSPIKATLIAGVLAFTGWLTGIRVTRHELLDEFVRAANFGKSFALNRNRPSK